MLSELIVHRGMGGTSVVSNERKESLTKQEISDILKYGAENLFTDDEEGQGEYFDQFRRANDITMLMQYWDLTGLASVFSSSTDIFSATA